MTEGLQRTPARVWSALFVLVATVFGPTRPISAQSAERLASECATEAMLQIPCAALAGAAMSLGLGHGLGSSGGTLVPGAMRTLGRRLPGGAPRLALSLRSGGARVHSVAVNGTALERESAWAWAVQGGALAGLLDGFQLLPTVGGVLSLDVFATLDRTTLPFEGPQGSVTGAGIGARLGIVRESFAVPGITVTAASRWSGELDVPAGAESRVVVDPRVTSLRGVVGKDLLGVAALVGVGRDWLSGPARIELTGVTGVTDAGQASVDDLDGARSVYFAGLGWNFLVVQVDLEAGWAGAFDGPAIGAAPTAGGADATRGVGFGALSIRLII